MTKVAIENEIIEDYEPLIELRQAFLHSDKPTFDGVLAEISTDLADEYRAKIEDDDITNHNGDRLRREIPNPLARKAT